MPLSRWLKIGLTCSKGEGKRSTATSQGTLPEELAECPSTADRLALEVISLEVPHPLRFRYAYVFVWVGMQNHHDAKMTPDEFEALIADSEAAFVFGAWLRTVGTPAVRWSSGMYRLLGLHRSVPASHELFVEAIHLEDRRPGAKMSPLEAVGSHREIRVRHAAHGYRVIRSYSRYLAAQAQGPRQQLGLLFDASESTVNGLIAAHVLERFGHLIDVSVPAAKITQGSDVDELDRTLPLTPELVRAARGMLDWTVQDLAEASGLSYSTARRVEYASDRGVTYAMAMMFRQTFEAQGVRFVKIGASTGVVRVSPNTPPADRASGASGDRHKVPTA